MVGLGSRWLPMVPGNLFVVSRPGQGWTQPCPQAGLWSRPEFIPNMGLVGDFLLAMTQSAGHILIASSARTKPGQGSFSQGQTPNPRT
jgi:hypothetical protein